jgi:pimeloyl-ACP methyl ester carboxylesterase
MTTTSTNQPAEQPASKSRKRGCLFYVGRIFKWFAIVLVTLVLLGVVYQTVATELDKHNFAPRGELYSVNGHMMHMVCMGERSEGSPTVILQAGLSADSLWWYRIQTQLAQHTQVCAYDRPGLGWSEAVPGSRDVLTIVSELHTLLDQAGISAPYVMAGHSYGAIFTRIYAAHYPQEVAGVVLVDSGLVNPKHFANQAEFDSWKTSNDSIQALVWGTYRTGLARLIGGSDFQKSGYPPEIVPEMVALHSPNQVFDTSYAEAVPAFLALTEASANAENLGTLPMIVLWASETNFMMEHIPALTVLHDEIATYSSNTATRIVEGADHGSILGNEQYAQQVSAAVLDVIAAAQSGKPLT